MVRVKPGDMLGNGQSRQHLQMTPQACCARTEASDNNNMLYRVSQGTT